MEPPWKAYNVMRRMEYPYEASAIVLFLAVILPNSTEIYTYMFSFLMNSIT